MTARRTVAGVDSSTQSCKVVVCDADTGELLGSASAPHPDGTEVDPEAWWRALERASDGLLDGVSALAVAGQQHGMVALDDSRQVVRPSLLWNDLRSAQDTADLVSELGREVWARATGSVPAPSFTVTKLRWLRRCEPANADRTAEVMLPHDWLTWRLAGSPAGAWVTDRGDASGTGYWSPATGSYRLDLAERALGHRPRLPRVAAPAESVGITATGAVLAAGTGDNMAAALGLGAGPGDVVVSLGTSGVVSAVSDVAVTDPSGVVAGFADATGRYLPLVCTLNAARVLGSTAALLGVDVDELSRLALSAAPGAGGVTLLPYLEGERTPPLPHATGSLHGLTGASMTPANLARAAVEGMLCGLAAGLDALRAQGVTAQRIVLIGGAARSAAVRAIAPMVFGLPVTVPAPAEYVALGAARQAAWAHTGAESAPVWSMVESVELAPSTADIELGAQLRGLHEDTRQSLYDIP